MKTVLENLDALIAHYDTHGMPARRITVKANPTELGRLLGVTPRKGGREFDYRGHVVVAAAPDPTAARFLGGI